VCFDSQDAESTSSTNYSFSLFLYLCVVGKTETSFSPSCDIIVVKLTSNQLKERIVKHISLYRLDGIIRAQL
jgi:hypothetical protein